MLPHVTRLGQATSGIARVVEAYFKYLPSFGVELVDNDASTYDLKAVHAGMTGSDCNVCHSHGLYWTADYDSPDWEYRTNAKVIDASRSAKEITVPSSWVAETYQRDMHLNPTVIPHGIDWNEWQGVKDCSYYVLWNKNRQADVCDVSPAIALARRFPDTPFISTFAPEDAPDNVRATDVIPHEKMKRLVQKAGVYLSTTKETWGIGILEAMASGVPVLGFAHGGILDLVEHGVNGYLADPDDLDDLERGLHYCQDHNRTLGENGRLMARRWTWENACKMVAEVYERALKEPDPTVAIIIPSYNYADVVGRAIQSATRQSYPLITDIIVVDDGSTDDTASAVSEWTERDSRIRYVRQENGGVATARNHGISLTDAKYVCCLDADDRIKPSFIQTLVPHLEHDQSLGAAYTSLVFITPEKSWVHSWPSAFDYDEQIIGYNQIPTCCLFRKEAWERLGGYRQRYAPRGCGAEDAEFWLRMGAIGYDAKHVDKPLFLYSAGGYTFSDPDYEEPDWLSWHPWVFDHQHPFASVASSVKDSHPVRQYDEPMVSVVVPVGPGHEEVLTEALDSVLAQTYRRWELIVVLDGAGTPEWKDRMKDAYPFATWIENAKAKGAGAARNQGASRARAPYLLFLDADDWLLPHALEAFLKGYSSLDFDAIIYSESFGVKTASAKEAARARKNDELVNYDQDTKRLVLQQSVTDFDHAAAIEQPFTQKPYFWCYITSLLPTDWHEEIGGFDESLPAWEDWDYWIRLAKAGKPFVPIHQELMIYSYDSGRRRVNGQQIKGDLYKALRAKHEEIEIMSCRNCGRSARVPTTSSRRSLPARSTSQSTPELRDENFVMCRYVRPKRGAHPVTGVTAFPRNLSGFRMRHTAEGWVIDYGYHTQGDEFLVHISDQRSLAMWFQIIEAREAARSIPLPTRSKPDPKPPEELGMKQEPQPELGFDLQTIPGVTPDLASILTDRNLDTPEAIVDGGSDALTAIKGIGPVKAEAILAAAEDLLHTEPATEDDVIAELEALLG